MTKKDLWVESLALFFPFFFLLTVLMRYYLCTKNGTCLMCTIWVWIYANTHTLITNRHIQQLNFSMFLCLFGFFVLFVVRMLNIFLIIEQKVRCRPVDVTRQSKEQKCFLLINENKTVYLFPFLLSSFIHSLINSFRYLLCSYYVP